MNLLGLSLAETLDRAAAQAWTPERVMRALGSLDLFDRRLVRQVSAIKTDLIPLLEKVPLSTPWEARLQAGYLLLILGEAGGTDVLLSGLAGSDRQTEMRVLAWLTLMPLYVRVHEGRQALPLKREAVLAALWLFLEHQDTQPVQQALRVAMALDTDQAKDVVRLFLHHHSHDVRADVIAWCARRPEDSGALVVAGRMLFGANHWPDGDVAIVQALETYCRCGIPAFVQRAADLLTRYVKSFAGTPGSAFDHGLYHALKGLLAAGQPDVKSLLEYVIRQSTDAPRRDMAFELWAGLVGEAAGSQLIEALADPARRASAARVVRNQAATRTAPGLLPALTQAIQAETRPDILSILADDLLKFGTPAISALHAMADKLHVRHRVHLHWLESGLTPLDAAARLIELGLLPPMTGAERDKLVRRWHDGEDALQVVFELFKKGERLLWFSRECVMARPDHLVLLEELERQAYGHLRLEAISQIWVDEEPEVCEVAFVHGGHVYSTRTHPSNGWYDDKTLIELLNSALAVSGSVWRCQSVDSGLETGLLLFAPQAAFREFAEAFGLPVDQPWIS